MCLVPLIPHAWFWPKGLHDTSTVAVLYSNENSLDYEPDRTGITATNKGFDLKAPHSRCLNRRRTKLLFQNKSNLREHLYLHVFTVKLCINRP